MFTIELTRGQDHGQVVKRITLDVPNLPHAVEGARNLILQAEQEHEPAPDGYRILDENGHQLAAHWAGSIPLGGA